MSECDEVCVEFSPPTDCRVCVCMYVCVCVLLVCRVHAAAGGEDGSGSC